MRKTRTRTRNPSSGSSSGFKNFCCFLWKQLGREVGWGNGVHFANHYPTSLQIYLHCCLVLFLLSAVRALKSGIVARHSLPQLFLPRDNAIYNSLPRTFPRSQPCSSSGNSLCMPRNLPCQEPSKEDFMHIDTANSLGLKEIGPPGAAAIKQIQWSLCSSCQKKNTGEGR